ncbi:MAG: hypothetical protein ACRDZN_16495 [Acidimicrobiales bacterium]
MGARAAEHDAPVVDAAGIVELLGRDPLGHVADPSTASTITRAKSSGRVNCGQWQVDRRHVADLRQLADGPNALVDPAAHRPA